MKRTIRRSVAAFAAGVAATVGISACSAAPAEEDVDTTLVVAVDTVLEGWDPSVNQAIFDHPASGVVFEGLVTWDVVTGEVNSDGLAKEFVISDDRLTYEMTLRDDVDFVDGAHLDAAGVEEYFDGLLASDGYAFAATAATVGAEFTATGEYTLELTTTTPVFHPDYLYLDIIRLLLGTPILSPTAVVDPELAQAEPLGTGPYILEETIPEVESTFVRNPDYRDPEAFPYDIIVFKALPDPIAKLNALKSGQVDIAPLTVEQVQEAESSGLTVNVGYPTYYNLMVRDVASSPLEAVRDVRVRQAMMLAFDRETIAETLDLGYGRASSQAFIVGQAEYIEGGDDRFGYDLERARDLMAEAGYADGFDLEIPTYSADARVQPIVQQSLADIGIRVTYVTLPDITTYYQASMGGDYPVVLYLNYNINTLRLLDEEFTGLGRFFEPNDELADLLETIKYGEADESAEASQVLGEMLLGDAWVIPFSSPGMFYGSVPDIEVAMNDNTGYSGFRYVRPAD